MTVTLAIDPRNPAASSNKDVICVDVPRYVWQKSLMHISVIKLVNKCYIGACWSSALFRIFKYTFLCQIYFKTIESGQPANAYIYTSYAHAAFLLLWPWPWSDDLDIRIWSRYSEDVPAYQKWSFYKSRLSKVRAQRGQTDATECITNRIRGW